ncbi:cupin domain-containing protein [Streptomyces sp. NPDC046977]|uniref:cupin domain-containing protein n=1 Tax=Streptomyces sp. NPDC046977 TaxID=3154703 RepID=UPI0033EB4103
MVGNWGTDGWAVAPGEGERVEPGGRHWLEVLVRGKDVDDALGVFVFTHDVITENPPHAHHDFMKVIYVLEGRYDFRVGDATFSGGPGTVVVVPRGSQHTFTTPTGGRALFVSSPAGNEELFLEMGKLGPHPTERQLAELNARFGTRGPDDHEASWQQMHETE